MEMPLNASDDKIAEADLIYCPDCEGFLKTRSINEEKVAPAYVRGCQHLNSLYFIQMP